MEYTLKNPFLAPIKDRYRLNKTGSTKETWHLSLDLSKSDIEYRPGDSIAVLPKNDPEEVLQIIKLFRYQVDDTIKDPKDGKKTTIFNWLVNKANLATVSKKMIEGIHPYIVQNEISQELEELLRLPVASLREQTKLWNVLEFFQLYVKDLKVPLDAFVLFFSPLLPRFYSIASSKTMVGNEVHLLVSRVQYEVHGIKRRGVCSHFLCDIAKEEDRIPIYVQPTEHFLLPEDDTAPIIMIGPGTGVAPFRAFMQERMQRQSKPHNNWLFFGERHEEYDFFYSDYWNELSDNQHLILHTAFSRDSDKKVYVQHKMWQERKELWRWIENGAYIYVCGDAVEMAKDVEQCLHEVVQEELGTREAAKTYLASLRASKRYLRDVY